MTARQFGTFLTARKGPRLSVCYRRAVNIWPPGSSQHARAAAHALPITLICAVVDR